MSKGIDISAELWYIALIVNIIYRKCQNVLLELLKPFSRMSIMFETELFVGVKGVPPDKEAG